MKDSDSKKKHIFIFILYAESKFHMSLLRFILLIDELRNKMVGLTVTRHYIVHYFYGLITLGTSIETSENLKVSLKSASTPSRVSSPCPEFGKNHSTSPPLLAPHHARIPSVWAPKGGAALYPVLEVACLSLWASLGDTAPFHLFPALIILSTP